MCVCFLFFFLSHVSGNLKNLSQIFIHTPFSSILVYLALSLYWTLGLSEVVIENRLQLWKLLMRAVRLNQNQVIKDKNTGRFFLYVASFCFCSLLTLTIT